MIYIGQYLPQEVREALKRNNTSQDIDMIARMTGVSGTTIRYLINGSQPLTDHSAKAFDKLVRFAKSNSLASIEQLADDREILANITEHSIA